MQRERPWDPFSPHTAVAHTVKAHSLTVWPLDAEGLPAGDPVQFGQPVTVQWPPPPITTTLEPSQRLPFESPPPAAVDPAPEPNPPAATQPPKPAPRRRAPRRRKPRPTAAEVQDAVRKMDQT